MTKQFMMKKMCVTIVMTLIGCAIIAQYPQIPPALQDSTDKEMAKASKLADEAWQRALPIIESDAKKRKTIHSMGSKAR